MDATVPKLRDRELTEEAVLATSLATLGHRGDQQLVALDDVVYHRHGRPVRLAGIAENARAVAVDELPPFFLIHAADGIPGPAAAKGSRWCPGSGVP